MKSCIKEKDDGRVLFVDPVVMISTSSRFVLEQHLFLLFQLVNKPADARRIRRGFLLLDLHLSFGTKIGFRRRSLVLQYSKLL